VSFVNRVCQALHDEHRAAVALLGRLEGLIARHGRGGAPDAVDGVVASLLSDLVFGIGTEIASHFDFEESELFPRLEQAGEGTLGAHLMDEHGSIRPVAARLLALAREAAAQGFDADRWDEFRRVGNEYCVLMHVHIEKEDMALLPAVEATMDPETEMRLMQKRDLA